MLIFGPIIAGIVAALAMGGRLGNWAELKFRWPWVVVVALLIRFGVAATPLGRIDELRYVYFASVVALIAWTLWHVDRLPGVWLVSLGSAMNLVVIAANDFRMPVVASVAGRLVEVGHHGQYVVMDSSSRLPWLADWLFPGVLGAVYSPGDVVIGLGLGVVAFAITRFPASRTKLDVPQANSPTEGR